MAGVHTVYRTTNGISSNYTGMEGNLKLPSLYGARPNEGNYKNGAFPEFFYGFYPYSDLSKGLDCGIICEKSGYKLFIADNGNGSLKKSWDESTILSISNGADITLKATIDSNKLYLECLIGSSLKKSLSAEFASTSIYNKFMKGCWVNREMCLSINPDKNGKINLVPAASFIKAKFYNTSLIATNGTKAALTKSNSKEYYWEDSGFPKTNYYDDTRPVGIDITINGHVSDEASATTDKITAPII